MAERRIDPAIPCSPVFWETEDQHRLRFQVELEFVQCLANPTYLTYGSPGNPSLGLDGSPAIIDSTNMEVHHCFHVCGITWVLAQRGYLKDKTFVTYLKYLQYWKKPEYAKYLKYPMCLYFLELLQYEHFRREIANAPCAKFIEDQQLLHWQHYTRKRTRLFQQQCENNPPATTQAAPAK